MHLLRESENQSISDREPNRLSFYESSKFEKTYLLLFTYMNIEFSVIIEDLA